METTAIKSTISVKRAATAAEIAAAVADIIARYESVLPRRRDAAIVIKPNLNSNMNALTGNTTDLRVLAAVVRCLRARGFTNITIAEGTNSGFYRQGINVIGRLKVDRLAEVLGAAWRDTNHDATVPVSFEGGVTAEVARTFVDAECFINIPKLKMHYETLMSACLKSLIGCLAGMRNKQRTHYSLIKNICNLNERIKPTLQILDAVIAMEGTGPTTGTPLQTGLLLAGTDPYLLDLAAAAVAHVPVAEVPVLVEAGRRGKYGRDEMAYVDSLGLGACSRAFRRPQVSLLTALVTHKRLQKYFQKVRHAPGIGRLLDEGLGNKLLFKLKVTQEVMVAREMSDISLSTDGAKCRRCGRCVVHCPMGRPSCQETARDCISCLYCYCICPAGAIALDGEVGFFGEQLRQYDDIIRQMPQALGTGEAAVRGTGRKAGDK